MSDDLAAILAEHGDADDVTFDLTTPRQYTQHGGWNERCQCGAVIGDHQSPGNVVSRHRAHVAQVIADTYLPAVVREAEARALREAAEWWPGLNDAGGNVSRWLLDRADRLDPDAARGERACCRIAADCLSGHHETPACFPGHAAEAKVARVEAVAAEFEPTTIGRDFFGNPLGGWVPVAKIRAALEDE